MIKNDIKFIILLIIIYIVSIDKVVASSELGINMVKNPSFEENLSYWNPNLNTSWIGTIEDSNKYNEKYSYKVTTNYKNEGYSWIRSDEINVTDNKTYLVRTHMKYENSKSSHIKIEIYDPIEYKWDPIEPYIPHGIGRSGSSNWEEYHTIIQIPNNITKIRFVLNAGFVDNENTGNATTWFDDIEFIEPIIVNPTKYDEEVSLIKGEGWEINDDFILLLEDTTNKSAYFSLLYKGYPIIDQKINIGKYTRLEYKDNIIIIFKLDNIFDISNTSSVSLKDILIKDKSLSKIPNTIKSSNLKNDIIKTQQLLLLIILFSILIIRNQFYKDHGSLGIDLILVISGSIIIILPKILNLNNSIIEGIIFLWMGISLFIVKKKYKRMTEIFLKYIYIHDFVSIIIIFMTASFLMAELSLKINSLLLLIIPLIYGLMLNIGNYKRV